MSGFVDSIRGLYPGETTVIITEQGNSRSYPWFRHAMFYLPEYAVYELQVGGLVPGFRASRLSATMSTIPEVEIDLPLSVERLVWFIDHWSPTTVRPEGLVEIEIPHGRYLYVLPLGRRPSTTRTTPSSARSLHAAPPAPRVPGRGELLSALARWRADGLVVAAALLPLPPFVAREWQIAGAFGFPLDDSWIHLHFARNLAAGAGFSYNPGTPIAGSTAPLWTLLLGAGAFVVSPSLAMAKTIGIVATVAAALVTRRAALAWGARGDIALVAAIALTWMGPIVWGALSGMEVSLAALLVAAALLAHARDHALASAVCAALAVLARPEALLLVPFLAAARPLTIRRVVLFAAVTIVVVAPAVLFSLQTAGTPYPASAAAKVEGGLVGWLGGVREPAALTFIKRPPRFSPNGSCGWPRSTGSCRSHSLRRSS